MAFSLLFIFLSESNCFSLTEIHYNDLKSKNNMPGTKLRKSGTKSKKKRPFSSKSPKKKAFHPRHEAAKTAVRRRWNAYYFL
ncbi:MAG: hypothetical protein IKN72_07160 [Clostridia bacterium]|nr:hypothetical protein [Clostridia bacterium]